MTDLSQYHHAANTNPTQEARLSAIYDAIKSTPNHPLQDYQSVFEQVVAWGDMDIFQHLNNVRYYDYAQSARIDHLTRLNLFKEGIYTIIVSTSCQYQRSVVFPDTLWIGVRIKKVGNTSLAHEYAFYSTDQQALVATGESVIVQMTAAGDKLPFTDEQKQRMAAFKAF